MTTPRALLAVLMLVAVGLVTVAIRGEAAKAANRVQRLHQEQAALRRELWAQEMELARLRGPEQLRRRASELGLDVVPPTAEAPASRPTANPR